MNGRFQLEISGEASVRRISLWSAAGFENATKKCTLVEGSVKKGDLEVGKFLGESALAQFPPQQIEGLLRTGKFERFTVVRVEETLRGGPFLAGQRDEDGADRFCLGAAGWASDSGNSDRKICLMSRSRAFGHFANYYFAHGTVFLQAFRAHAEKVFLGFVAITDDATH